MTPETDLCLEGHAVPKNNMLSLHTVIFLKLHVAKKSVYVVCVSKCVYVVCVSKVARC